jgi:hypothetical protein
MSGDDMNTTETIMALVDRHAKDMLMRFSGAKVDPDKSRAAVHEALQSVIPEGSVGRLVSGKPIPVLPLSAEIPAVSPPKAKRASIFGGKP